MNTIQPNVYQPVINPRQIDGDQADQVGHLWPRAISYSMETNSYQAYIQSNLKVGVQHNYSFNFELSARNNHGKPISIPDGWYQLQIAVIKKQTKNQNPLDRYVTSSSMFVKVTSGSFGRRVSLRFPEFTHTSLKHHLFIELIPLREECESSGVKIPCITVNAQGLADATKSILEPRAGYKTYLVEMPFIPYAPTGGKMRDADDLSEEEQAFLGGSLAKYIARAQLHRHRTALKALEDVSPANHAKKNLLHLVSTEDAAYARVSSQLRQLLDKKSYGPIKISHEHRPLLEALCGQLVAHQTEFQERYSKLSFKRELDAIIKDRIRSCALEPEKFMRLSRVVHAGRPVPEKIERVAQKSLTYTIMANYMKSRAQSRDSVSSVSIKTPTLLVQFTDQIGLGLNHSVNFVNGRSEVESGIGSMSTSLDFNYVIFNLTLTGSQQCLEVRALPDTYAYFYNRRPGAKTGLYICAPKNDDLVETPEIYAHAFERCKDTTLVECDSLTQSVNVSLRGERELSAFFYAIRGGITPDHRNLVMPFGDMENAERYFANVPLMDDMEIVTPIEFAREKVPSFLQMISFQYREF